MEYEGRQWTSLSAKEQNAALDFIPPTYDQDLGPNFRSCVAQKVAVLHQKFDLGKTGEGGCWFELL